MLAGGSSARAFGTADEEALFAACSSHFRELNPTPDPEAWAAIADPDVRTETALRELYAFYGRTHRMYESLFRDEGLVSDSPPIVAAAGNAGNPHYMPTATEHRAIRPGEMVLLDLWGKLERPGAVFADITWVGYTGSTPPERYTHVFNTVAAARDAAISLVQRAVAAGQPLRGWQVDRAASTVLRNTGFGANVLHRTGHSLGESVHGNGVNMDDYETHDDRRLLAGTGFTIEPGLYFDDFGVRSEINMLVRDRDAIVTGTAQTEIVALG